METQIEKVETEKVRAELAPVLRRAEEIAVTDESSYQEALLIGQECAKRSRAVEDLFKPSREAAHKAWKTITETVGTFTGPLETARKLVTRKATDWQQAEQRRRDEEARVAQEKANHEAEERRIKAAVQMEAEGNQKIADAIIAAPVVAPVVQAAPVAKPAGVQVRENWQAEVTDLSALIRAVQEGKVGIEVLQPNLAVLRTLAKITKGKTVIPGVRVWNEGTVAYRTGR
jgi:hypothetical protein